MIINLLKMNRNQCLLKQLKVSLVAFLFISPCFVLATQLEPVTQTNVKVSSQPSSNDSAISILQKMQYAVQHTDYQIYFVVQESNDDSDTLRYRHLSLDNGIYGQLLYLERSAKEIILYNNAVSYFQPESVSFSFPSKRIIEVFPDVINPHFDELSQYYDFVLLGKARAANRNCQLIRIIPKDKDRYNYVVWIDETSSLPLRIDLLDLDSNIIKQMKVLSVDSNFDKQSFKHDIESRNYPILFPTDKENSNINSWQVDYLPKGFKESATYNVNFEQSIIDTRLFSDGIFSFTVNVSSSELPASEKSAHAVVQGINTIYSINISNMNVVIIGNIPLETIEKIARSIKTK